MRNKLRTFVAVDASPDMRAAAGRLIGKLQQSGARVSWVAPENLHLTLQFLGHVDALEIPDVCRVVTEAVAELPPFGIEALGAGAFPSVDNPRTVWIGLGHGSEELCVVQECVEKGLATLGYRGEQRRFKPHLTIGRARGGGAEMAELSRLLTAQREFPGGAGEVVEVVVYSSSLSRDGSTYEPLAHAPLEGR